MTQEEKDKITVINMVVINALEPNFVGNLAKFKRKYDAKDRNYQGHKLTTEEIWESIKAIKSELGNYHTPKHRRLYAEAKKIAPSSVLSLLSEIGIDYVKDEKVYAEQSFSDKTVLAAQTVHEIGKMSFSCLPILFLIGFVLLLIFTALFGEGFDTRNSEEKALDNYCTKIGRSGCSDTARRLQEITED